MILRHFLRSYRITLIATAILSGLSAAITLIMLAQINALASAAATASNLRLVLNGAGWFVALLATSGVSQFLLARLGGDLVAKLRTDLSQRFIDLEYEKLANRKHLVFGSLIEDISRIGPLVLLAPLLAYNVLLAALCAAYLIIISVSLAGIFLACLSVSVAISIALVRTAHTQFDEMRRAEETVFEYFRSISEGKKEMSMNAQRANHFVDELLRPAIRHAQLWMTKVHLRWGFNEAWSSAALYGSIFATVYLGHVVLALPSETIIRSVIAALFLVSPLNFLIHAGQQVGMGLASLRHLQHVGLDLQSDVALQGTMSSEPNTCTVAWKHIRIVDATYRYHADTGMAHGIGPVNLDIRRGEMVFLSGGNGSGKSTLLLLLCSLLRPSSGQIFIDGRPVLDELLHYRSRFSGVFGDFFLFSHVLDAAGNCVSDVQIETLLRELCLDTNVQVKDGVLSRLNLSTGQRKRLALLQCYAEDRDICFFDEWAADQDVHFREHFYCVLLPELKARGKTVLAITHDDRYFHVADRLIKLESGHIVSDSVLNAELHSTPASTASLGISALS
jgi:putative ATP-binding cassette transporter